MSASTWDEEDDRGPDGSGAHDAVRTVKIHVRGMTCGRCVSSIQSQVYMLPEKVEIKFMSMFIWQIFCFVLEAQIKGIAHWKMYLYDSIKADDEQIEGKHCMYLYFSFLSEYRFPVEVLPLWLEFWLYKKKPVSNR